MRAVLVLLTLLASVVAINATTVISLCPTGVTTGCSGTYSYQYIGENGHTYSGSPVVMSLTSTFTGWVNRGSGKWVSIADAAALAPEGMQLFDPQHSPPVYDKDQDGNDITSDPLDTGSGHSWTHGYLVSYTFTFDAPAFRPGTARLAGAWAADDGGMGATGVFMNNVLVDAIPAWGTGSYAALHAFDVALSNLLPGTNTLEFRVDHADSWYDGVIVDSLTLTGDPTPEPASLLLVGAGAALLFFRRRRC
ncbi:MAG: PEP-CTERM sorting domain-containing protein [Acidobacteriia bacterium]|nr:PEP-CTERM sorting domain-containing protein [Terriglobia bacterium]